MEDAPGIEVILKKLSELSKTIGPGWTFLALLSVVLFPTLVSLWRDRHLRKAYEGTIKAKDSEIERMARDNREWRDYFFRLTGITEAQVLSPRKGEKGREARR